MKRSAVYLMLLISLGCSIIVMSSCVHYTITTTENNPSDIAYKEKVIKALWWGKINVPQRLVDSCGDAGLDEVKISSNFGYTLLHLVTLGIVHKVKVEWKCHKACSQIGFKPTP